MQKLTEERKQNLAAKWPQVPRERRLGGGGCSKRAMRVGTVSHPHRVSVRRHYASTKSSAHGSYVPSSIVQVVSSGRCVR